MTPSFLPISGEYLQNPVQVRVLMRSHVARPEHGHPGRNSGTDKCIDEHAGIEERPPEDEGLCILPIITGTIAVSESITRKPSALKPFRIFAAFAISWWERSGSFSRISREASAAATAAGVGLAEKISAGAWCFR